MRPQPLRDRIVAVLRLQPMTFDQLARALSASHSGIEHAVQELHQEQRVLPCSKRRVAYRPRIVWGVA